MLQIILQEFNMRKYFKLLTVVVVTINLLLCLGGCCIEQKESEVSFSVGDISFTDLKH